MVEAAAHEEVAGGTRRGARAQTAHVVLGVRGDERENCVSVVGVYHRVRGDVVKTDRFVVATGQQLRG